jgi:hypothetical protein
VNTLVYLALGLIVILVGALVALRPWPFPPSLTVDDINAFARQNTADPGRGTDALATYYGWRQDLWSTLARGVGALAVALFLALAGASLEAGTTVKERTVSPPAQPQPTKVTSTESTTSPETLALIGGLIVIGAGAWLRTRAVQREFAGDVGRVG